MSSAFGLPILTELVRHFDENGCWQDVVKRRSPSGPRRSLKSQGQSEHFILEIAEDANHSAPFFLKSVPRTGGTPIDEDGKLIVSGGSGLDATTIGRIPNGGERFPSER